jgi:HEAT repeat protein
MGGGDELWELYQSESDMDVKESILEGFAIGGSHDHLMKIASGRGDPELRATAIEGLGISGGGSSDFLVELFLEESDEEIQEAALDALAMSGNAQQLVELARKEKDPGKKRMIVERLVLTGSEDATNYLMELLDE